MLPKGLLQNNELSSFRIPQKDLKDVAVANDVWENGRRDNPSNNDSEIMHDSVCLFATSVCVHVFPCLFTTMSACF